eukprot:TRINITY_DN793_c1_g4_i1.p1 TRINITY_DN793_c1_g4~~TRINITY_DN793_c1_g4_i1.p1  ORF type:complete len:1115 (+),score=186.48 TRINITY_DN793_c1_g4_i1:299-3643(+)
MAEADVERECRICRGEDEPGRPLLHPCRCSGSIKYTHEDCLVNWLAQSGSTRCELCNHSFRFEPLYQPNTPSALPTFEFLTGVLALLKKTIKTVARIILVFTVWLFFLPIGTCWTWYALFINSPTQLPALLASRGPAGIVTDAFYGFLLSAGIVFVFLGVSSLREYVRHLPQEAGEDDDDAFQMFPDDDVHQDILDHDADDEHDWPALEDEDEENDNVAIAHAPRNHVGRDGVHELPPDDDDRDEQDDLNGELVDEVDELVRDTYDFFVDEHNENDIDEAAADLELDNEDERRNSDPGEGDMIGYPAGESDAYASSSDYIDDEDFDEVILHAHAIENPAQLARMNRPQNDHPDEVEDEDQDGRGDGGALFGLFELDPDEVPLEEVVGLRGHIRNLFDNAGTVLISNAIFLGIFTLIPLLIGRLALRLLAAPPFPIRIEEVAKAFSLPVLMSLADQPSTRGISAPRNGSMGLNTQGSSSLSTIRDTSQSLNTASLLTTDSQSLVNQTMMQGASEQDQPLVSYIDNFLIVLLGYGMIALVSVSYIGAISLLRHRYPRLDSPVTRQVARMLRYVATFIKIVVLILFEFGVFPLGCGWWLDICTLELFGGTTQSRLAYCRQSPWACTSGHWVLGIVYMAHISLFITLLREVIRPELLWFLRNPDDPEFHPFRELVEKPLSRHARRMCLSVLIYVPLIMALVYVPGQLCLKLLPHVFPFRSEDFSHILIDVPFGNLLIGPLIRLLYFGRPELSLQVLISCWIRGVSCFLGIRDLVVKGEGANENVVPPNAANGAQDRVGEAGEADGRGFGAAAAANGGDAAWADVDSDGELFEENGRERRFVAVRAALMILAAWGTLVVVESSLVAIPTMLGRWLMSAVGLAVRHDLHPFLLGLNVLLGSVNGICKVGRYFRTLDTMTMISMGMPYLVLVAKGTVIISIWLGVIPLMTGLLFELIFVPMRVSHNETAYFCLHQDWALGLLLLKVWSCIAATGGLGAKWRERVLRAKEGELAGLDVNFWRTMREVVLPVLGWCMTALCMPYSISRGVLPMVGVAEWVSDQMYRYAYLVVACLYCSFEVFRYSMSVLRDLHDSIRDDKYLVGKRLYNFGDSQGERCGGEEQ